MIYDIGIRGVRLLGLKIVNRVEKNSHRAPPRMACGKRFPDMGGTGGTGENKFSGWTKSALPCA